MRIYLSLRDAATEGVDAFGVTRAEHKEERVGEEERFVDPGGLGGEIAELGLEGDAEGVTLRAES